MNGLLSLSVVAALASTSSAFDDTTPIINVLRTTTNLELNPSVQHIPLDPYDKNLRPPPAKVPNTFEIHIGSSVFRDGQRCGKTLFTALKRAVYPERLRFGILEQLVEGDPTCLDEYCIMAEDEWPDYPECRYKDQIKVNPRPAAEASGCTTARHQQQEMIGDEEFCLQVDGHSIFTNGWDEIMLDEWKRIDNEMAILTVYPHDLHDFVKENGDNNAPDWIPHLCTTIKGGNGLTRIVGASIKRNAKFPQMAALWGGGLSFSKCHAERNVPVDSHTPWLWDGEEFLRSADYWTHGYDLYSPSKIGNVLYHNYSKKPASFWESPVDPEVKRLDTEMTHNRVRLRVGLDFKGPVDGYELNKYKFGTARTFQQYLKFANMTFEGWMNETNSCGQLHWVPYTNATEVEEIVGDNWKMNALVAAPTPQQLVATKKDNFQDLDDTDKHVARAMAEYGEEEAEDSVKQRLVTAHKENGAGIGDEKLGIVQLRQETPQQARRKRSNLPAWGLLAVVLVALFVTLSNDRKSLAIRQSCVAKAPHLSHD
ncbi:[Skp1-protein]-hydroxyproline N-acetylglucosaminyltransferase [Phytophthora citrophthora]|uniref:[Skp1-protein]-hydroxyproline N-acetylglucosaminyltransferase n=1 Tax=Phytophthora citrophthora TaxID=4793 RepID=A0AAD9LJJ0_9STRA|nr:[Skp1-protein]-hydroxyproline N-acetylglucosaminyltransferase [Phytophthora citrophthora]